MQDVENLNGKERLKSWSSSRNKLGNQQCTNTATRLACDLLCLPTYMGEHITDTSCPLFSVLALTNQINETAAIVQFLWWFHSQADTRVTHPTRPNRCSIEYPATFTNLVKASGFWSPTPSPPAPLPHNHSCANGIAFQ